MLELQTLIWTADLVYVHMYSRTYLPELSLSTRYAVRIQAL